MALLTADVPTLLGVCSGIAVLAGLLCLVLHLYTRGRMPDIRHHHYADANMSPPMLFTSETGITGNFVMTQSVIYRSSAPSDCHLHCWNDFN